MSKEPSDYVEEPDVRDRCQQADLAKQQPSDVGMRAMQGTGEAHDAAASLRALEGTNPETWQQQDLQERLATLRQVESQMALLQGRPEAPLSTFEAPKSSYAAYNPSTGEIQLNTAWLADDNVQENVDNVVHEGRHAYQHYAVMNPGFHDDPVAVAAWRDNFSNYLDAELVGQYAYEQQPIERDARAYAQAVTDAFYDEGERQFEEHKNAGAG